MFGSTNPFGEQNNSNSPFGSQPAFGQQNNSNSNPFATKPFGSTNPFGSQTGNSMFGGGTSTGVFGAAQTSPPFSSNTTFGASSSLAFGSSAFGQKPAFGGFGSTPTQTSPFGSATQPSQPAFGNSVFGSSTPFGASTQPTFGSTGTSAFDATSTPVFGATSTPAFGATSTPAFGATSTPAFGATSTPAFGSTPSPTFGSTGSAFSMSTAPGFGVGGGFGAPSNPMFGSASTSAFGTSSSPFGASSAPDFGALPSSTPAFSFGSSQAFGQSSYAFGSSSPFGSTMSAFGSQTPTPAFGNPGIGQSGFGGQRGGSRIANYTPTTEPDSGTSGQTAKLESISAMPTYKDKSHEELRWEDYQLGDKGGPLPSAQSTGLSGFNSSTTQTNTFGPSPAFGQSSPNPFSSTTPSNSNPFAPNSSAFPSGFGVSAPSFSSSAFGPSTSATTPSMFSSSSPSPFVANSSPSQSFGAPMSLFNSAPALSASQPFGSNLFSNTQSSQLFSSTPTPTSQPVSGFGQQTGGSRIANYTPTTEPDSGTSGQTAKLESISAMPTYKDKSHEELRWEDYQLGDKGGPLPSAQSTGLSGFNSSTTQTNTFGPSPAFGQSSPNPFSSTTPSNSNPLAPNSSAFPSGFGVSAPSFSSSAFGPSTSATTPSMFSSSSPSPFVANSSPSQSFGAPMSLFNSAPALSASQPFGSNLFSNTQSSQLFISTPTPTSQPVSGFGQQTGGSRIANYTPTTEPDSGTSGQTARLESISAMPTYKDKSHEELRWEDYQLGDKGGPLPSAQSTGLSGFNSSTTQTNTFGPSPAFGQSSPNPFSSTTPSNSYPFAPNSSAFPSGFGVSAPSFSSSAFGPSTSATTPSMFSSSSPSPFVANSSPSQSFGALTSLFNSAPVLSASQPFGSNLFSNTQSSQLFSSTPTPTSQPVSGFGQQNPSPFGQQTTSFTQSSMFNSPSSGFGGSLFSTSAPLGSGNLTGFGQTAPSLSTPFQPAQLAHSSTFGFSNFSQTQPGSAPGMFGQSNFGLSSSTQSSVVVQTAPITNPFGTLPALPQMSIGRVGTTPSIQHGISSMPAPDKPASVRISSLLTSRHLSQRRSKIPVGKYHSKNDGPKVAFFSDDEDTPTTPKADALFIPRENPRALIICFMEQWPARASSEKPSSFKDRHTPVNENGTISKGATTPVDGTSPENKQRTTTENGTVKEQVQPTTTKKKPNGKNEDHSPQKVDTCKTLSGQRAGEAAIVYEHGADVEALMPKLRRSDYYTLPQIHELAAKERAEPGFCSHIKDFVVGRQGYGSIRFLGETDVRGLDIESLVQFNNREVIVYMYDAKKPPVGQGLNKPAEVTLLNIKCFDKKTGQQYTEGPKIEKYKDMLKRKAEDQGAEFVSYDAAKGEWKIKVNHFSGYKLDEDSWDDEC